MSEQVRATQRTNRDFSRRQFLQYSAAGLSAALLTACAPTAAPTTTESAPAASGSEAPAASGPVQGGTLRLMGHQEVSGMGPQNVGASVEQVVVYAIHNPLVQANEALVTTPVLAESYEVAEDGLTYTFNLVQGVKFHNDADFTAADVVYTYDYYRNPDNATTNVNTYLGVGSVEAPDDFTVVVTMDTVNASSLVSWAEAPIVQSTYHAEVGEEVYPTAPVGTGAFKLVNWVPAEVVELEAFEDHFRGRAHIDFIRQEVVPDAAVRAIALETGDSDAALWPLLVEDSQRLAEDPENFTVLVSSTGGLKHIPLNNNVPALAEKEVRQAMLTALDRQRIVDELWNGAAVVAHTHYSPKFAYYSKSNDSSVPQYNYDVAAATALLDGAGWVPGADGVREKDGVRLSFTCTTITGDTARRPIAELAQQMLSEVGVEMLLEEAPVSAILEALPAGEMEASLFNWTYGALDPDPGDTLRTGGSTNFNNYSNPRVDELIDLGVQTVVPEERQAIYHEIQDIIAEDVPMLYLQWDQIYSVFSGRVKGLPSEIEDSFSIFFTGMHTWWLDPVEA